MILLNNVKKWTCTNFLQRGALSQQFHWHSYGFVSHRYATVSQVAAAAAATTATVITQLLHGSSGSSDNNTSHAAAIIIAR